MQILKEITIGTWPFPKNLHLHQVYYNCNVSWCSNCLVSAIFANEDQLSLDLPEQTNNGSRPVFHDHRALAKRIIPTITDVFLMLNCQHKTALGSMKVWKTALKMFHYMNKIVWNTNSNMYPLDITPFSSISHHANKTDLRATLSTMQKCLFLVNSIHIYLSDMFIHWNSMQNVYLAE